MTQIKGVYGAVDDVLAAWRNDIEDIRALIFEAFGNVQGVLRGFVMTPTVGSLAVDFTAGAAIIEQRGTDITGDARGYFVYNDVTFTVPFTAPPASTRSDAVVFCWGDRQYGALGASVQTPGGPQVIVVPGVSGSTTPRTDAQIQTAIGVGGWFRFADVLIAPGNTVVAPGNITDNHPIATGPKPKKTRMIASGNFVKSTSPAPKYIRCRGAAGGGAGGSSVAPGAATHSKGGGGGAGQTFEQWYSGSELAASTAVVIGAAGVPAAGAAGGNGGNTVVSAAPGTITVNGGTGGAHLAATGSASGAAGGAGGTGGTAADTDTEVTPGGAGTYGWGDTSLATGGTGGSNTMGFGGKGGSTSAVGAAAVGDAGSVGGGGGGGAASSGTGAAALGGAGGIGEVVWDEFF